MIKSEQNVCFCIRKIKAPPGLNTENQLKTFEILILLIYLFKENPKLLKLKDFTGVFFIKRLQKDI